MPGPTLYPGAHWRPLGEQTQARMRAHDIICLHTMVGSLAGTDAMFHRHGYGGTESHFGVGPHGTVHQWQDLDYTADANLDGNDRVISIETADSGDPFPAWNGSDVPAWTSTQIMALAYLIAWLTDRYDIPLELIQDSRPGRRGIGYHRLGVDPWRVPGGERWSTKVGKACPGDRRIAQIPEVIERARQIQAGDMVAETKFEQDVRAMWAGMAPGGLAQLDRDLHGDLAVKAEQLGRIEAIVCRVETKLDRVLALLEEEHSQRSVPLYPSQEARRGDG